MHSEELLLWRESIPDTNVIDVNASLHVHIMSHVNVKKWVDQIHKVSKK